MMLKGVFMATVAALVAAFPLERRGLADCAYIVNPSGVPDTTLVPLFSEWNFLIGLTFALLFPGNSVHGSNSVVTGPDDSGLYTVKKSIGTASVTNEEAIAIVTGWAGRTFDGPYSHVTWTVESVTCK